MRKEGESVHVSEEEASGGSKEGVVRWVLIIGTLLAIGALSIIWITGAVSNTDPDADNVNVERQIAAEESRAAEAARGEAAPVPPAPETDERRVENGAPIVEN